MQTCAFCAIVRGDAPATRAGRTGHGTLAFHPLQPYVPGHVLVIPTRHVQDAQHDAVAAALCMREAALLAETIAPDGANLLTSIGRAATQTVMHLHVHILPRGSHDGLGRDWPWNRTERGPDSTDGLRGGVSL